MARLNGSSSTDNSSKRRLIQPALPALPSLSKTKRVSETRELEAPVVNGSDSVSPDASATSGEVQPATTLSGGTNAITQEISVAVKGDDGIVTEDNTTDSYDKANTDTALNQDVEAENNQETIKENTISASDGITTSVDPIADTDVPQISDKPSLHSAGHPTKPLANFTQLRTEDLELEPAQDSSAQQEVEATGNIRSSTPQHSQNPSISNSSIQQTPEHAISLSISNSATPDNAILPHANGGDNGAPEVVPNGTNTSTKYLASPNGTTSPLKSHPRFPTVTEHIRNIRYSPDWFDCEICVYYPYSSKPLIYRNAHSLLLVRSDRMRNFIYPQRVSSYTYYVINLYPARSIDANAFDAALQFLYTDNILSADRLFPLGSLSTKAAKVGALNYVMSYMIAGLELGIEPVITRSLDLLGRLLDWDIAELAIREGIQLRSSVGSAINPQAPSEALFVAKSILQHVFNLIVLRLDTKQFKLDTVSQPVDNVSRLAAFETGRGNVNPALASISFGSMPASANMSPSSPEHEFVPQVGTDPDRIASIIMLNLDFEDLSKLSAQIKDAHSNDGIRVMRQVIEERECRRASIFGNRSFTTKQRLANAATWDVIGWREFVTDSGLQREHVGFVFPSKRNVNH